MKKLSKITSLVLAAAVMLSSSAVSAVSYGAELSNAPKKSYSQIFYDVPKSYWAFSYIGEMAERGVLDGYPDGNFYPENDVTRAEFAKIMTAASGLSVSYTGYSHYDDVDPDDWCSPYIESARYYLSGYLTNGQKLYLPDSAALREDIAVALVKLKGYDTSVYDLSILKTMFSDWQSISSGAQKYVAVAVQKGLISGYEDGTFKGQQGIVRSEAATLLWRAYQYGNDNKIFDTEKEDTPVVTETPKKTEKEPEKQTEKQNEKETEKTTEKETQKETEKTTDKQTEKQTVTKKLPYKVDSLGSASVSDTYLKATQDGSDNLYYYDSDDNIVYRMSMKTGKKAKLLDVSSLKYEFCKDEEQTVIETVIKKVPRTITVEVPVEDDEQESETDGVSDEDEDEKDIDEESDETADKDDADTEETDVEDDEAKIEKVDLDSAKKTKLVEKTVYDEVEEEVTTTKTVSVLKGTYKGYEVRQLYYNTGNGKLLLVGKFKKYRSVKSNCDKDDTKSVIYEIDKNSAKVYMDRSLSPYRDAAYIIGNMDNGNLFVYRYGAYSAWKGSYDTDNVYVVGNKDDYRLVDSNEYVDFIYTSGNDILFYNVFTYWSGNVERSISKYNQSTQSMEALWDDRVSGKMYGINNKNYYIWNNSEGKINKIDVEGEPIPLNIDTKNGVEVKDFLNMPTDNCSKAYQRIFITNDESFVFYDAAGDTWRKIEKQ